ncbi:lipopolysaccharide biosynthesis protein [Bacteroidota bacterium]
MKFGKSAKKSFKWSFLIQIANQVIGFVITIILARILSPSDFGVIGIITIFINLSKKITDGGLAASLIRTNEIDDKDFSVVFYFNFVCSLFLYLILFFSSEFIAYFFKVPLVESLLKVYGISIIISAFTITQSVRLNKGLDFKTQFLILLPSLVISGGLGIVTAYLGLGVWSLVIKELSFALFSALQLWFFSKWKPLLFFDWAIFKYHFSFAYKLVLADLISQLFKDSYNAIISKSFSPAQLGYFSRAKSMEELPSSIVFNTVNRVLFPMLSLVQDSQEKIREVYSQIIQIVTFLVVPFLMLLNIVAEPLFVLLLTDKWLPAVPYFKILILGGMIAPLQPYLLNICKVKGRSDLVLKLSLVEYAFIFLSMLAIIPFGILGLLWGIVIATFAKLAVAMFYVSRLIDYSIHIQLKDLREGFILSFIGLLFIYALEKSGLFLSLSFVSEIVIISILYYCFIFLISLLLRFESIKQLKQLISKNGK